MSMARPTEAEIVAAIVDKTFYYVGKAYLVRDPLVNPVVSTRYFWIDPKGNTASTKQSLAIEVAKALNKLSAESRRDIFENERVRAAFCDRFAQELATTQHIFSADFAERAAGNLWSKYATGMVRVYSEKIKAANWGDALHRALEALSREPVVITPPATRAYPPEFDCPITQDIMRDPVVCADGNSYEAEAIAGWFALGRTTSPMSRAEMGTLAIPNRNLKKIIEDHLAHRPVVERELLEQARLALDYKVALEKFTQEYDAAMERLEAKSAGLYVVEAGTPSSLLPWTSGAGVGAGASATATADSSMPFSPAGT